MQKQIGRELTVLDIVRTKDGSIEVAQKIDESQQVANPRTWLLFEATQKGSWSWASTASRLTIDLSSRSNASRYHGAYFLFHPGSSGRPKCSSIWRSKLAAAEPTNRSAISSMSSCQPRSASTAWLIPCRDDFAVDQHAVTVEDDQLIHVKREGRKAASSGCGLSEMISSARSSPAMSASVAPLCVKAM